MIFFKILFQIGLGIVMAIVGLVMFLFTAAVSVVVLLASIGAMLTTFVIYLFKDYKEYRKEDKDEY